LSPRKKTELKALAITRLGRSLLPQHNAGRRSRLRLFLKIGRSSFIHHGETGV
jgi:hypothetical protein